MLPLPHKIAFLVFALLTSAWGFWGFYRLYRRIRRGHTDPEPRFDRLPRRLGTALFVTLTQQRTFKKRPFVGLFHSFIFYGFTFYLLVNLVDALEGFFPFHLQPSSPAIATYLSFADILSFLVLLGVLALVARRFLLPSRRDFRFNARTLLHPKVASGGITRDSILVSAFILFHVGSRALGSGARLALEGPSLAEPFATLLAHLVSPSHAVAFRIFGFWGALGSVLAFLAYFPYTKHIHIFLAPVKYAVARRPSPGVIPPLDLNLEATAESTASLGARSLEDLAWPRLLDAYACIQCNRCQDVCPASATGKSLSPAALEINKRMELNLLADDLGLAPFETGAPSPHPLLQFALSPEAAWACTTCGACMEVCPVQDEQMLDILDIRRHQVMVEGDFPAQLQSAFRGMERAQNPWGINRAKRMDWAEGLSVPTTAENPTPDVLYWVGCAASYDPSAQKTARAFVQLLDHAEINFAVLGKRECCTGDSARRAGNEYLYRQLADENVSTLNTIRPKLIVASCPHCMNSIGNEYKQIGGDYEVMHHTEYLETLVGAGKLIASPASATVTYHDPCYLGRHNGVYDAPRNLLKILSNDVVELPRNRENAFCCGAGGAQFWKEEEEGDQRVSDNRFHEAEQTLAASSSEKKVLAVGCPFCKSMLSSTPLKNQADDIDIKDVAELLLEGVVKAKGVANDEFVHATTLHGLSTERTKQPTVLQVSDKSSFQPQHEADLTSFEEQAIVALPSADASVAAPTRKKWMPRQAGSNSAQPKLPPVQITPLNSAQEPSAALPQAPERKKWQPKAAPATVQPNAPSPISASPSETDQTIMPSPAIAPLRKKWNPRKPNDSGL